MDDQLKKLLLLVIDAQAVRYEVTGPFGSAVIGQVLIAYRLAYEEERNLALLWHPISLHNQSASFSFCSRQPDGTYKSAALFEREGYVNVWP